MKALHSAALQAAASSSPSSFSPSSSSVNTDYATSVVMEFLSIIKRSRKAQPSLQSPFVLMKQVWKLILSITSKYETNTNSSNPGRMKKSRSTLANELAMKFDVFLPEGYSMVSSSLLLLEEAHNSHLPTRDENENGVEGGCARTEEEFTGML